MYEDIREWCQGNDVHLIPQVVFEEEIYVGVCRGDTPGAADVRAHFVVCFDGSLVWDTSEHVSKEQLLERISAQTGK